MVISRLLAGVVVVGLSGSVAQAQLADDRQERARQLRARVQRALNLAPQQQAELQSLRQRLEDELVSIRDRVQHGEMSALEGGDVFGEAMRAHREARDLVLSADQRALLMRAHQYATALQLALPPEPQPEPRRPSLVEQLALTRDQQAQWRALRQRQREALLALQESGIPPGREEIRQMREDHRQAFERLLTPEQGFELAELRREWESWQSREQEYAWPDGPEPVPEDPAALDDEPWAAP